MRFRRLYSKMFFAAIGLLLIAQVLIFGLFRHVTGRPLQRELTAYIESTVGMVRELVEYRFREHPDALSREVPAMRLFVEGLGTSFRSLVWIENASGIIAYRSSPDAPPPDLPRDLVDRGSYRYHVRMHRGPAIYAQIRCALPNAEPITVHILHQRPRPVFHETEFILGLAGIAIVMALLLYPLARYITRPLQRLTRSAHGISGGDFRQSVDVDSADEIGELARAFNAMAERISMMVRGTTELTANISHELRSPLARMRVALELLDAKVRDAQSSGAGSLIASLDSEITEMDRLIDRILQLSKLDLQESHAGTDEIAIGTILQSLFTKYRPAIEHKALSQRVEVPVEECRIVGNRDDIVTVLGNLIDNAVKFTPAGGAITARCAREAGGVSIDITNTAAALTDDELRRIFDPFARLGSTSQPGHGLGLAITKKIVEKHGGSICARATEDGVRFEIILHDGVA